MNLQHINVGIGTGGVGTATIGLTVTFNIATPGDALQIECFNAFSPATVQAVNLTTGDNTFNTTTCPALASAGAMIIMPPVNNGEALKIKGIGADTGLTISAVAPTMLGLNTSPFTSFVINSAGAVTGLQLIFV